MNEFHIEGFALKPFIKKHLKFFDSRERMESLKEMSSPNWTERDFELGMISVASRIKHNSFSSALKSLFILGLNEEENKFWNEICKYPGKEVFWEFALREFKYSSPSPSLKGLLLTIMLTNMKASGKMDLPSTWEAYVSDKKDKSQIFIDHWQNHSTDKEKYEKISQAISEELNLKSYIKDWHPDEYVEADGFEIFDKGIIIYITNALMADMDEYDRYLDYILIRKARHWYDVYKDVYNALESAISMFSFKKRFLSGFSEGSPEELFNLYISDYSLFDTEYRKFYYSYDRVQNDILKKLQPVIENLYKNWFLANLSTVWLRAIKNLSRWPVAGIEQQKDFYRDVISSVVDKHSKEKIFVIISDGLRYEAGKELMGLLNQETRGATQITAMQSVIPSYTKLGMASLLPYKEIELDEKGRVLIDGKDSSGTEARDAILKNYFSESIAVKLNELTELSKDDGRELIKSYRIIYLYHDTIDVTGDDPKSENKTFTAVQDAVNEIFAAVKKIVNNYGTNVYITSDHGF
ncbi:MAG: BREX-1 system phosphatase PglZ type A, partial [Nitrospirota bacterium]